MFLEFFPHLQNYFSKESCLLLLENKQYLETKLWVLGVFTVTGCHCFYILSGQSQEIYICVLTCEYVLLCVFLSSIYTNILKYQFKLILPILTSAIRFFLAFCLSLVVMSFSNTEKPGSYPQYICLLMQSQNTKYNSFSISRLYQHEKQVY